MAVSAKKAGIAQFAGDGFDTWKFRVGTQLSAQGVRDVLEADPPAETASEAAKKAFKEKDEKAKALLVAFISDSHLEYVREKATAKAMWQSLGATFMKKGFAAQTYIRRSLAMLRMEEGSPLKDHFRNFDELVRQLKDAGAKVTDLDQVSQLFISLPASYDVVTTAIENLEENQLTLETVKSRLLAEEQKRNGRDGMSGLVNRSDGTVLAARTEKQKKGNREGNSKFSGKCYGCGAFGHKRSSCPRSNESRVRAQAAEVPMDREVALVGAVSKDCSSAKKMKMVWILDSGASRHMSKEVGVFCEMKTLPGPVTIESAINEGSMKGAKQGIIKGNVETRSGRVRLAISKVLFVPNLKFNLLSLGALINVGAEVSFEKDRAVLTKDGEVIGEAVKQGNLYYMTMEVEDADTALATGDGISKQELWHKRYGHLSYRNLLKLQRLEMVNGLDDMRTEEALYETCAEAKLVRLPFNGSRPATNRPLERVHTDVCGKITPATFDGYQYFVTFLDDYTHFAVVYLMKKKDQVFEYFKIFQAMATANSVCR